MAILQKILQQPARLQVCSISLLPYEVLNEHSQHTRCHTKPFICEEALCTARFGTKTHLQRHKNVNHRTITKFYCKSVGCSRSRAGNRHFNRMDYCKNHVRKKHQMGGEGVDVVTDGEA